jgi:hypothetical protein
MIGLFFIFCCISSARAQVKQETEPNDTKEQANIIQLGESVEGYCGKQDDEDWYKLVINLEGRSLIRINITAVPNVKSIISVHDAAGKEIRRMDQYETPPAIPNLGVTKGTYYIRVMPYTTFNAKDKYALSVQLVGPWKEGHEYEPNDYPKTANEIKLEQVVSGNAYPDRDNDWFVFQVPPPGLEIMVVEVEAAEKILYSTTLYDAGSAVLNSYGLYSGIVDKEPIMQMKVAPGKYYMCIYCSSMDPRATYSFRVGKPSFPPATDEEVGEALSKALNFLAKTQTVEGCWNDRDYSKSPGTAGLASMAFLGSGSLSNAYAPNIKRALSFIKSKYHPSSKYPAGSKDEAYFGGLIGGDREPMYEHAIAVLAFCEALVNLEDTSLEPLIEEGIQLIARTQNTEEKPQALGGPVKPDSPYYGGWRYKPDSLDADISVTGWHVLALKAAQNAGFKVPDLCLPKAAQFVRNCYYKSKGTFLYTPKGGEGCGRTAMGILSLQIAGYANDPLLPTALRFLQERPPQWLMEDPGDGYPMYYWYYGTRAMLVAGGEYWRIWKDWICRFLVKHQNAEGGWEGYYKESGLDAYRTALGALILELCGGHLPLYMSPVKRLGPAYIKVDFEKGAEKEIAKNVEIIMDASNSMTGLIGKETKITVARRVLTQIINGLPETMNVGLRVYGHRYPTDAYQQACQDTELLVPIGPVQKAKLVEMVNKIQTKGRTPLVLSVLQAIKDFEKMPNGSVVLVTDGIESCNGDIKSISPAIKKSGLDLKVHIVGFDIKEKESREQLEGIAKSTEGMYLDAKDANGLLSALEQTLKIEYVVLDEKGEVKARGFVGGEAVKIPEGSYTLRIMLAPLPLETKVTIKSGESPIFTLKKEAGKWSLK